MTNRLAIYLGIAILLAALADQLLLDGAALIFLGRKGFDLIEWLAFWR